MTTPCPSSGTLKSFADSLLDDAETERIEKHLAECERCRMEVERLEQQPGEPLQQRLRKVARLDEPGDGPTEEEIPDHIGQYKILGRLGSGGMGTVYRAEHPHLKREVAVKVVKESKTLDPTARTRFVQEMQSLGKLTHPNIVHATDAGIDGDLPFIVTELLDGQDLGSYIDQHGKMPVKQAVDCIRQAATGLAYAHKAGYVHRDIKPSNLFLLRNGNIKVLDLGIARQMDITPDDGQTMAGYIVGSPNFMAPEQLRGKLVDARSDIYSLGRTFACLLTGRIQTVDGEPIPAKLKLILDRTTAEPPDRRYQTADELLRALDAATKNTHIMIGMAAALVAILLVVGFMLLPSARDSADEPLPTRGTVEDVETKKAREAEDRRRGAENKKSSDRFKQELSAYKKAMAEWEQSDGDDDPPEMPDMPEILPPPD